MVPLKTKNFSPLRVAVAVSAHSRLPLAAPPQAYVGDNCDGDVDYECEDSSTTTGGSGTDSSSRPSSRVRIGSADEPPRPSSMGSGRVADDEVNDDDDDIDRQCASIDRRRRRAARRRARRRMVESIVRIAAHVPRIVVESILEEEEEEEEAGKGKSGVDPKAAPDTPRTPPAASQRRRRRPSGPPSPPTPLGRRSALLFVDISGFTDLSRSLDAEGLSVAINSYFELIVDEIWAHGGDVIKFMGDAVLAEWPALSEGFDVVGVDGCRSEGTNGPHRSRDRRRTQRRGESPYCAADVERAALRAARCGARILARGSDFRVCVPRSARARRLSNGLPVRYVDRELNVHCGLGVGTVVGIHCGESGRRKDASLDRDRAASLNAPLRDWRMEYLLLGDPIDQVARAEARASHGELAASPEALAVLARIGSLRPTGEGHVWEEAQEPAVIASRGELTVLLPPPCRDDNCGNDRFVDPKSGDGDDVWREGLCARLRPLGRRTLDGLFDRLAAYVHPVVCDLERDWVSNRAADATAAPSLLAATPSGGEGAKGKESTRRELHRALCRAGAELRTVYTMFVMPAVSAGLTGDPGRDAALYELLDDIMAVTMTELSSYGGQLRQFVVDDKGVVLVATFGLRGSTAGAAPSAHVISDRALPATLAVREALEDRLGVDSRVGAAVGRAYCGVVGGVQRHEYAVLGPSVNLAARLACHPSNPGVLVDEAVRRGATGRYDFDGSMPPVSAKGYDDPVAVYEPLSPAERRWKRPRGFVGRRAEIQRLVSMGAGVRAGGAVMALVSAESGVGKSSMVYQAIQKIKQLEPHGRHSRKKRAKVFAAKAVCDEFEQMVPFSACRSLIVQALCKFVHLDDESDCGSSMSGYQSSDVSLSDASDTSDASAATSALFNMLRFRSICQHLGRSDDFAIVVGERILGIEPEDTGDDTTEHDKKKPMPPKEADIIEFLVEAVLSSLSHFNLSVLAIDDVHWMDVLSWKVLQALYSRGQRLLLVCATRPTEDYELKVDASFWAELQAERNKPVGRYQELHLSALERADIPNLIARVLELPAEDIDVGFSDDVYERSGGMPFFARELVQEIKREGMMERRGDCGKVGWRDDERCAHYRADRVTLPSLDGLLLRRLDALGTQGNLLQFAAVLGFEFRLSDIIRLYTSDNYVPAERDDMRDLIGSICQLLGLAVQENILVDALSGNFLEEEEKKESEDMFRGNKNVITSIGTSDSSNLDRRYRFSHAMWRKVILGTMLEERQRDMHRSIAIVLERSSSNDYNEMIPLLHHWKSCGEFCKASELALKICNRFDELGTNLQSISLLSDTLRIWQATLIMKDESAVMHYAKNSSGSIGGITLRSLDSIGPAEVVYIIKLYVASGRCLGTAHQPKAKFLAFYNAVLIFHHYRTVLDRSISFPIFSGLLLSLQQSTPLTPEDAKQCEHDLVQSFVEAASQHGDLAHMCRALAAQARFFASKGKLEKAIQTQEKISQLYSANLHSAKISCAYGSDRAAQSFGLSTTWFDMLSMENELACQEGVILKEILPRMDLRNVHNSFMLLFPLICTMKRRGRALEAKRIFSSYIVEKFEEYFGGGKSTFFLPMYKPTEILLGLAGGEWRDAPKEKWDKMTEWALHHNTGQFRKHMEDGLIVNGRDGKSTVAEVCLLLACNRPLDDQVRKELIQKGILLAKKSLDTSRGIQFRKYAHLANEQVFQGLMQLLEQNHIYK